METDLRTSFLAQLVASPAGRSHLLSISVDAEEGDEAGIFEQLIELVDDPKLARIVARHRDDEERHARMFRGCLDRLGLDKQTIPDELKIVSQIGTTAGGPDPEALTRDDVVAIYAMLLAIEERGVEQFPVIAEAFGAVDADTADVYRRVARDERGHTRYCHTIGRHHAQDDAAWDLAVAAAREIEAMAFIGVGLANVAYCIDQGWVSPDLLDA